MTTSTSQNPRRPSSSWRRSSTGLLCCCCSRAGWPAVVGLAGMVPDAGVDDSESPDSLYELFADEIYRGLDPGLRTGLAILAAMPHVDRELAAAIFGAEQAERICDDALGLGLMDARDGRLELHPLAAAFFGSRGQTDATRDVRGAAASALEV